MSNYHPGQLQFAPPPFSTTPTQMINAQYYPPPPQQLSKKEDAQPQQQKSYEKPPSSSSIAENHEEDYADYEYPGEDYSAETELLNTAQPTNLSGAPTAGHFVGAMDTQDGVGQFNGGSYRISHRDSNTLLTIQLAINCPLIARHGAMIAISPTVKLQGKLDVSLKTIILRSQMALSTFTGPGEVLLAPYMLGDITSIRLSGDEVWSVAKDAYLACTQGVERDFKKQGLGKAIFSGDGLFVFRVRGTGIMWITSFGAIVRKDLVEGEKYLVDNGHLVAWNTKYILQRAASRGLISGLAAGEGLVCKFTGPGTVLFQTRNPAGFYHWIASTKDRFNPNALVGGKSSE
ncbi:DUF124 domain-containing protein [Acephala macrosclerotiorum]|nr:DUF124 domain-containing protein [Acephala macrosclerotiorum]